MKGAFNVLYIHPAGAFGGASRSLLEMINAFPVGSIQPVVLAPRGSVGAALEKARVPTILVHGISQFDNTRYGYYRKLRWLLVLRELAYFPATLVGLVRARRLWRAVDLVHVNEITALPAAILARWIFGRPVIVHVRSLQRPVDESRRAAWIARMIGRLASAVVAIDETVKRTLPSHFDAHVIHNGLSPEAGLGSGDEIPDSLYKIQHNSSLKVAIVGNLLPMKGVYEFTEAARICRDRGLAIDFLIVGANVREVAGLSGLILRRAGFAHDVRGEIEALIRKHRLEATVHLVGATRNIWAVYRMIDVLCFPSHLNAAGRPVFEAAFFKVPSIVAVREPSEDTIVPNVTGLCIEEKDPVALADAIEYFYRHPEERRRMGDAAYRLASRLFDVKTNALQMLELYRSIVEPAQTAERSRSCVF
jgi:glycosyltransferase involved in cell wall biosynthesis